MTHPAELTSDEYQQWLVDTGQVAPKVPKRSKYGAVRTEVDGIMFASKAEASHYSSLKLLERAGAITDLELQPRYTLTVNKMHVGVYVADFRFTDTATGKTRVQDVKGVKTPAYRLKKKLVRAIHGIEIEEVTK